MYEVITFDEYKKFNDYLKSRTKTKKFFYTSDGIKTIARNQFYWKYYAQKPRINWLNKEIKRLNNLEVSK